MSSYDSTVHCILGEDQASGRGGGSVERAVRALSPAEFPHKLDVLLEFGLNPHMDEGHKLTTNSKQSGLERHTQNV